MTTTTMHVPATPLPTIDEPCNFGASRFELQGDGRQIAVLRSLDEAQEIRRRANAYPRLVKQLQAMTHGFRATGGPSGSSEHAAFVGAEALLREIGESE